MFVICEAVDGGGKTHRIHALTEIYRRWCDVEGYRYEVDHLAKGQPVPGSDAILEYEVDLQEPYLHAQLVSPTALVLADRWHVGEAIYGPLYRGGSRLDEAQLLHVELFLTALGTVKLLVQPAEVQIVHQRLIDRGEDFLRPEHTELVHQLYEQHGARYGYTRAGLALGPTPLAVIEQARANVIDRQRTLAILPGYVGNPHPEVLLVGDRRNDGPHAHPNVVAAFTPILRGSSSHYLLRALLKTGLANKVGIVNAHEPGVELGLIPHLGGVDLRVVALGNQASTALDVAGVAHQKTYHPQYWRRFKHDQLDEYAALIEEAAGVAHDDRC